MSSRVRTFILSARLRLRRAVPGDTRRAHCASPLTLADNMQVISFMQERKRSEKVLRDFLPLKIALRRTQEASGTGLLGITAPRGAFPASGLHPCLRYNLPSVSEAPSNGA